MEQGVEISGRIESSRYGGEGGESLREVVGASVGRVALSVFCEMRIETK